MTRDHDEHDMATPEGQRRAETIESIPDVPTAPAPQPDPRAQADCFHCHKPTAKGDFMCSSCRADFESENPETAYTKRMRAEAARRGRK